MQTMTGFDDLDTGDTLTGVEAAVSARRTAEVNLLQLAVRWADLHGDHNGVTRGHGSTDESGERRGHPDFSRLGGEGTPVVAEFATAELGVSLRVHPLSARSLMADSLDLRHRLIPLWEVIIAGAPVEIWVMRKIASTTRKLSPEAASLIATDLAPVLASLPPARLLERLEALVLLAHQAEDDHDDEPADARFVTFNQSNRRGLKGLYAQLAAGDAIVGEAQVQRLAELLLARDFAAGVAKKDLDPMSVARARALGLLIASPESALAVIVGVAHSQGGEPSSEHDRRVTEIPPTHRARVSTILHLHLSDDALQALAHATAVGGCDPQGVARLEGHGPMSLREALAVLKLTGVTIRPVLDPWATAPADSYAFTGDLREAVLSRVPCDVYPYGINTTHSMDIDHTQAYDVHGPPGQTSIDNAGPMTRHHHRIKTHGAMQLRQPVPDTYVWRTPHHRYRLVDANGTHDLDPRLGSLVFSDRWDDRELAVHILTIGTGLDEADWGSEGDCDDQRAA